MVRSFNQFQEFEMDILKEIGNIGAGNAATALATLLNKPVDMGVPTVQRVPFEAIAESIGGDESIVTAVYFRVEGEAPGNMFFMMTPEAAKQLLYHFNADVSYEQLEFTEMECSTLSEIGNILAGSYLSSLADFTQLKMIPTVPGFAVDMAGAILSYGLLHMSHTGDEALYIDTHFLEGHNQVQGQFFLIPDPDSLTVIFEALGVQYHD
ncbi:chemotaxis protein CheC [Paenibacillus sp. Marseille-Q4541]|uniref:chemotaxis protein CheC n=1 Tax=Paenibacillus sp. Marseille-Q4541 TaxID=2831522 RepID=UPI0020190C81|nr:chemotaxis protein CheC [Paenibacillus sp. Marseille-Q4541]